MSDPMQVSKNGRTQRPLDELGFYGLAGGVESARPLFEELEQAEQLGFGTAFISERPNKETMALSGAALAVTKNIRVATGVTNPNTRHPQRPRSATFQRDVSYLGSVAGSKSQCGPRDYRFRPPHSSKILR